MARLLIAWMFGALAASLGARGTTAGPYNAVFLPSGEGLVKPLSPSLPLLQAAGGWTLYGWVRAASTAGGPTLVGGLGDPTAEYSRFLGFEGGRLLLWLGGQDRLSSPVKAAADAWHFIGATFDGSRCHLYDGGNEIGVGTFALGSVAPRLELGPTLLPWPNGRHFGGKVAGFTVLERALGADEMKRLAGQPPDFDALVFEEGSRRWPVQVKAWPGYSAPQDPALAPHGRAPFSHPVAQRLPAQGPGLKPLGFGLWEVAAGWKLRPASQIGAPPESISGHGFDTSGWLAATVPGTVLTTLIDRGVYPDPDRGLDNLAIPESLCHQSYWYRTEFIIPKEAGGPRFTLEFGGINYRATVWLNGHRLGAIAGAFTRGRFDVSQAVQPGIPNVLAVLVNPPPHPGMPQEQSIAGGPGENGGLLCLDGPTFVNTEGWDWIPGIRDRDTGIWQPVTLAVTGPVRIGDPQVSTSLPLPAIDHADVAISVPLGNPTASPISGVLTAAFEGVSVTKTVTLPPGETTVHLRPDEFPQLRLAHPRLWWPNGYGAPALYHLQLEFAGPAGPSERRSLRFGIREITYKLSLLDGSGALRRVEYAPQRNPNPESPAIDVSHEGIRSIPAAHPPPAYWPPARQKGWCWWVYSFAPGREGSPAFRPLADLSCAPYLVIRVNGVRIACRGGNWGMDDARKRVSRERLEPYFRLHRNAHLNMIRNWMGLSSEDAFDDLADEYGLLVWNDFWESTQDHNLEPEDPQLFLRNAADTIRRYRNHPCIALWCGRNEGVPQPIVNRGLDALVGSLDGTRWYAPCSNRINLQVSGPYRYMEPRLYFTTLNRGFAVETGTASFPTLENFRSWMPPADQWPIDDVWAYHDWHQLGGGNVHPFMAEMEAEFGAPTGLEDFERKAQMLNYVSHRAIFEGMNAHLWAPNSGRLLWMTQPAWPSTTQEILSSDYDTQASFYGVMKACEPIHIQFDPVANQVELVNTTATALVAATAVADLYGLDNRPLFHREQRRDVAPNAMTVAFPVAPGDYWGDDAILLRLELRSTEGTVLARNLYWLGGQAASLRALTRLPQAHVAISAGWSASRQEAVARVTLRNTGPTALLEAKLTLLGPNGARILPAYYEDNYVSLLPGESRTLAIRYPANAGSPHLGLRGWNLAPQTIACPLVPAGAPASTP